MKNNLCTDIGYMSLTHYGEQLCGDHVEVVDKLDEGSCVVVLADGLGSGVKANILSILTSKMISTMVAADLPLESAVESIVQALPVCSERKIAYSTFTIIKIINNERAEIMQYENPKLIMLRDGENYEIPSSTVDICGKQISLSNVELKENDVFIAMSDGVEHAGAGNKYNFGWKREEIVSFIETLYGVGFTAKTLTALLLDETNKLYDYKPMDDATVCTIRIREREAVNLLFGPPSNPDDCSKMLSLFFAKHGKHIVSGGTTSKIVADFLKRPLTMNLLYHDPEIPPTASIDGVDLVTEGVVTINRVVEYAQDYVGENTRYEEWSRKQDGASIISRMLFEDATDVNFFVGRAINPAHQNPNLPIDFSIKMKLVENLSECLRKMGKRVIVNYF